MNINCKCGGKVNFDGRKYVCDTCKSTVWKNVSGKEIDEEEANLLFQGERVTARGLVSKKGSKFDADILIDFDTKKTTFDFL